MTQDDETTMRMPTDDEMACFEADGAVCLQGCFEQDWIERLREAVDGVIKTPGPMAANYGKREDVGTYFGDMYVWTFDDTFRDYCLNSPAAEIAGRMMRSAKANLFYDHLLVKEPGSSAKTPWHHDLTYWCVDGWQVCSVWMPLDPVTASSGAVRYVKGSHKWPNRFRAIDFVYKGLFDDPKLDDIPDIDAEPEKYEFLSWDLEPGDCIVFHALTVHGAPGNASSNTRRRAISTRWCGDDAVYVVRDGMSKPIRDPGLTPGDPLDCDLFPVVWQATDVAAA